MISLNKNPAGKVSNFVFGVCAVGDGLVRIFTLGFFMSSFQLSYARRQARLAINNLKLRSEK